MSGPDAVARALGGLRYLEAAGQAEPLLLLWLPRARNPFQALLYGAAAEHGVAPVAVADLDEAAAVVEVVGGRAEVALHLHWLAAVTERAADPAAAADEARAFLADLDVLRAAGCRIAWTIHNVLPHDVRHADAAILLRRGVVERAAMIHVLNRATSAAVEPLFPLPAERVAVIPHPSYAGVYPEGPTRDAARLAIGAWPDEVVLLALGALREYKGIPGLLDAWRASAADAGPRRLVVAGMAPPGPGGDELRLALDTAPGVIPIPRHVPVETVSELHRAADLAVMNHREALNSGALLLALTFGLPVVAPRMPATADLLDERVALLFEPGDPDGLGAALRDAPSLVTAGARARALEIAAAHEPRAISARFADELRRRLAGSQ